MAAAKQISPAQKRYRDDKIGALVFMRKHEDLPVNQSIGKQHCSLDMTDTYCSWRKRSDSYFTVGVTQG
jgi:hypothetical protein